MNRTWLAALTAPSEGEAISDGPHKEHFVLTFRRSRRAKPPVPDLSIDDSGPPSTPRP
jgi:hypothetical protein